MIIKKEQVITDSETSIIHKSELETKLSTVDNYLKKVEGRKKQLERESANLQKKKEDIRQKLSQHTPSPTVSREM